MVDHAGEEVLGADQVTAPTDAPGGVASGDGVVAEPPGPAPDGVVAVAVPVGSTPDADDGPGRSRWGTYLRPLARAWPVLRLVLGLGLGALAIWVLADQTDELSQIGQILGHLNVWWIVAASLLELCSFLSFARMQHRLLRAGGLWAPYRPLVGMTFAAQSINNSLPAGSAFSAVYGFRWYRRFGAREPLAAWALVGTMVAAALSLALVAAAGVALATSEGASLDLITVVISVLLVTTAAAVLLVYERPLIVVTTWAIRAARRLTGRPRGDLDATVERVVGWITVVKIRRRDAVTILGFGLGNWLFDCGCFALAFLAVGAPIPWEGLLLAYGAGQLAANLPVTPGGLGAVEGSITIALVAFGGPQATTVAAVLLYRLISFWAQLPVGWGCAGVLALAVRRGRWPRVGIDRVMERAT